MSGRESMADELFETKGETGILEAPFMTGGRGQTEVGPYLLRQGMVEEGFGDGHKHGKALL